MPVEPEDSQRTEGGSEVEFDSQRTEEDMPRLQCASCFPMIVEVTNPKITTGRRDFMVNHDLHGPNITNQPTPRCGCRLPSIQRVNDLACHECGPN